MWECFQSPEEGAVVEEKGRVPTAISPVRAKTKAISPSVALKNHLKPLRYTLTLVSLQHRSRELRSSPFVKHQIPQDVQS